jgi:hypothetical protein
MVCQLVKSRPHRGWRARVLHPGNCNCAVVGWSFAARNLLAIQLFLEVAQHDRRQLSRMASRFRDRLDRDRLRLRIDHLRRRGETATEDVDHEPGLAADELVWLSSVAVVLLSLGPRGLAVRRRGTDAVCCSSCEWNEPLRRRLYVGGRRG